MCRLKHCRTATMTHKIFETYSSFHVKQRITDKKAPPTSFSPATSTNVGISPQNFLTFSFNPFDRLVQSFYLVPVLNY